MRLPAPLLRRNKNAHKNTFGHVLVIAGSRHMLGAGCLSALAALCSGAGLVSLAVPKSLNAIAQKKCSAVIMTISLPQTKKQTLSFSAYTQIKKIWKKYDAIILGPGLSENKSTQALILKIIETCPKPLVIDADGLNALSRAPHSLSKAKEPRILTPHPGEMARLSKLTKSTIEKNRLKTAKDFAKKYKSTLLLKGNRTVVASQTGKTYTNKTGNVGMATAGSGDVLAGIIGALLAQGVTPFESAKFGAYLHGKAGDLAIKKIAKASLLATDIVDHISAAIRAKK